MGADLIGYMCIGPKRITAAQKRAATARAKEIFKALRKWYADDEESGTPEVPEILQGLELGGIEEPCELESLAFGNANFTVADKLHVEVVVARIVQFWNDPDSRDSVCRDISDTEKVVFCGDISWGDEPDGTGYYLLKMAHLLDILEPLGIH